MGFVSRSQVGQDTFAYEQIGEVGTFLDIGSKDPFFHNNSASLEEIGWHGAAIDIDAEEVNKFKQSRKTPVFCKDATQVDWRSFCAANDLGLTIDYLSLDIEGSELQVLKELVGAGFSFRVITCEHNRYLVGDEYRNAIRDFLLSRGYVLVWPDVASRGCEFEDWWVRT
jgi:hypothetical protein